MKHHFTATLTGRGPKSAWIFLPIPPEISGALGGRGRIPVRGTINGFAFASSLLPQGDGTHAMAVGKELQAGAKAAAGDEVTVSLERDDAPRTVELPRELEALLERDATARKAFNAMPYSHRKEYAQWISSAKKDDTKLSRAQKAADMLRAGKRIR